MIARLGPFLPISPWILRERRHLVILSLLNKRCIMERALNGFKKWVWISVIPFIFSISPKLIGLWRIDNGEPPGCELKLESQRSSFYLPRGGVGCGGRLHKFQGNLAPLFRWHLDLCKYTRSRPLTQDIWFLRRGKEVSPGKGKFVRNSFRSDLAERRRWKP